MILVSENWMLIPNKDEIDTDQTNFNISSPKIIFSHWIQYGIVCKEENSQKIGNVTKNIYIFINKSKIKSKRLIRLVTFNAWGDHMR